MEDRFFSLINEIFKSKNNLPLYSSSIEHHRYITSKIIQKTKGSLIIYTGKDNIPIYDCDEIKDEIKKIKNVLIISDDKTEDITKVFQNRPINLLDKAVTIDTTFFISDSDYNSIQHFLVADGRYVRVDKSDSNKSISFVRNKNLAKLLTNISKILVNNN